MLDIILEDDFMFAKKGQRYSPCHLILTETFLDVYDSGNNENPVRTYNVADVVGCTVEKILPSHLALVRDCAVLFKLHVCGVATSLRRIKYRKQETVIFCCNKHSTISENEALLSRWSYCVRSLVRGETLSLVTEKNLNAVGGPKLLVFINPKSGTGNAVRTFENCVASIMSQAGISYNLIITKFQGHAETYVTNLSSTEEYYGFCVVSGDGLLFEVYNGLMKRKDWETSLSKPVGIIPEGSGNGLARSLAHFTGEPYLQDPVLISTLNIVKLRAVPCDLAIVKLADNTKLCSFLSVGWGLLADIDIESERLRILGETRFTVWALARLLRLRTYKARISYLPAVMQDVVEAVERNPLPALSDPVPEEWTVLEGQFVCIYAGLQPFLGTELFFAPNAHIHDGIMWLLIVQAPVSKLQLSQLLMAMSNGSHIHFPWLKFIPVTAFRLEPQETSGPKAHLTVDGENIAAQALQVEVLNGAGNVFMR